MLSSLFGKSNKNNGPAEAQEQGAVDQYRSSVAPQALEVKEDYITFPSVVLLPITARGNGIPGMIEKPWSRLTVDVFYADAPLLFSISLRREPPEVMKTGLRSRRTLMEGFLMVAAEKTGRRPSMADHATDSAMDQAESLLSFGKPIFRATMLAALFSPVENYDRAENIRRLIESNLRSRGLLAQRLYYIAESAIHYFQPGGKLFPGFDEPILFSEETTPLLPLPSRTVVPADDAVWIGMHARDGRDIHFSYKKGLDPTSPAPPHSLSLILGEMGSGKTTLLRSILIQRMLQGRTVLSIDPEGENNALCEAIGGKIIPAGKPKDPDTCLLHPLQGETAEDMLLAVRFLLSALMGEDALTPGIQAAIHEAVLTRWARQPGPTSIAAFVESLGAINSPDIHAPVATLRQYQRGSINEGYFDREKALLSTNFEPGQWYNFDLSTLQDANRNLVYAVMAWFFYHCVTVGKQPMDIFIDEGWRLLRSGTFSDLLDELGRRARKRGIGVTLITHLPQDLMRNPTSLSMASTSFIGRMGPEEAFHFFRSMGVTESEARANAEQVSRLPPRVFMAAPSGGRGALFPVQVIVPPVWLNLWGKLGATGIMRPPESK